MPEPGSLGIAHSPQTIQSCHNPRGAKISIRPPRNVGVPRLLGEDGHDQVPVGRALRRDLGIRIPTLLPPPSSTSLACRPELLRNPIKRATQLNLYPLRIPHRHRPRHRALRHNGKGVEASCGSLGNIEIALSRRIPPSSWNRAEYPPIRHPLLLSRKTDSSVSFCHIRTVLASSFSVYNRLCVLPADQGIQIPLPAHLTNLGFVSRMFTWGMLHLIFRCFDNRSSAHHFIGTIHSKGTSQYRQITFSHSRASSHVFWNRDMVRDVAYRRVSQGCYSY